MTEAYVQLGFAGRDSDVPGVRKDLHDKVIEDLGGRRRSGVTWHECPAKEAPEVLDTLGVDLTRGEFAAWLLDYPDGTLVVATAECEPA